MQRQIYTTIETRQKQAVREEIFAATQVLPVPAAARQPGALYFAGKRLLDITGALCGLILLFPLYLLIAILVRRDSPGPIFHRRRVLKQQEIAADAAKSPRALRTFDAFKFRTMIVDADEYLRRNPHLLKEFQKDYKLREDPRVTPLGRKLRTTSLDELPQLINVLHGQMTLVGPRMISPPELEMYGEHAARLLSVKPGLTGLWQVSGRQHVSYQERVRLDMHYIDSRSLLLDLRILLRTVACVFLRKGAF